MSLRRIFSIWVLICFCCNFIGPLPFGFAAISDLNLPKAGIMVNLSPAYEPALIKGLTVHQDNPFLFDFIVDTGHSKLKDQELKAEGERLVKYFFAGMTIPEKDFWVNLSPYEKNRIIADNLGQTEMGRDMLAQDYILKQITASLIYPEKDLGKAFWDAVYTKARQMYGTTQIPVNTFNKVWIVADKADVFEKGNVAYIVGAHLKVMLEEDYLALTKYRSQPGDTFRSRCPHAGCQATQGLSVKASQGNHHIASEVIRQIILPQIEHEVNAGQNFAPLRQMFYSMILASWYKMALKDAILTQIYGNKSKVKVGINQADPKVNEEIFQRYLKAYKKGVFNYIKEDIDQTSQQSMPKKYFSGGEKVWASLDHAQIVNSIPADVLGPTGTMEEVIAMVNVRNGQYTDMRGLKRRDVLKFERRKALREARKIFFQWKVC